MSRSDCLLKQGDPDHKPARLVIAYDPPGTPRPAQVHIESHELRETILSCVDCFFELTDYVRYDLEGANVRCTVVEK